MVYANSADPDQLFAITLSISRNNCIKSQIYAKILWNKVFKILGHLLYIEVHQLFCQFVLYAQWTYNAEFNLLK